MKDVFTSAQAARLLGVSPQTVIRAIDAGTIPGFRVVRSKHRRVSKESLVAFMVANGLSLGELGADPVTELIAAKAMILRLAERVADQSELLSGRAEKAV